MFIAERLVENDQRSDLEQSIATYFLEKREMLAGLSTRQIAADLYTTAPTIVRFCQHLGFKGYQDFREQYLAELAYAKSSFRGIDCNLPFTEEDDVQDVIGKMAGLYRETLDDTIGLLDRHQLLETIRMLSHASSIQIIAAGSSWPAIDTFAYRLSCIGFDATACHDMGAAYLKAQSAARTTSFLFLSYSGETEQLIRTAEIARKRGLPCAAITSVGDSHLSSLVPLSLRMTTHESLHGSIGHFSSIFSAQFIMDILYCLLFQMYYDRNIETLNKGFTQFEMHRSTSNPMLGAD